MKNRFLSIVLSVIMVLSISISAFSETDIGMSGLGDVNNDGKITASDARILLRVAAKLDAETEDVITSGDIDFNGKITAADARTVLRVAAKLENISCIINGHNFKFDTSVRATCITEGCDIYKCTVCGTAEKRDVVGTGDHSYEIISEERVTTDTSDGFEITKKCKYCDNVITVYEAVSSAGETPQTDEQWLLFFNDAVNKLKTEVPAMTKLKQTRAVDILLSNPLGNVYVSMLKDAYLSDEVVETPIAKGDKSAAQANVSPDGAAYVSKLTMADIKSISHTTDTSGNYVVTIAMNDVLNPDSDSSFAKIFQFLLVNDIVDVYASEMGMVVDRKNIEIKYSNCYATATITPDGKVIAYETMLNSHVFMREARIAIITSDIDITFVSNTKYCNIQW